MVTRKFASVVSLCVLLAACGTKEAAVVGAGAAAAAKIVYDDRGANTNINASVAAVADAAEQTFRALNITLTERKTEADGTEVQGRDAEWKYVVDIERDAGDTLTEVEVTVSKDQVNYNKDRAELVLRGILTRL